ncbi:MAG: peptidase inhibitor family I36 protein [Micromonosporaceae bacterium]|nr:peptidase inhibitor family I36 protein [Micromonosporaceae bacterium]
MTFLIRFFDKTMIMEVAGVSASRHAARSHGAPATPGHHRWLPPRKRIKLCLFENQNGGGRRLIFQDEDWQELDQYGFANTVTSWRNNQTSTDTGGLWDTTEPGVGAWQLSANTYCSNVGSTYNDRADRVKG